MNLIEAKGIAVVHGGVKALDNVSLSVQAGEIVTIVGPNGSGKTTLVRALIGAITVNKGQILRKDGLRVGYVPQKLAIDPTMPITVERFLRLPKRFAKEAIVNALEKAGAHGLGARQMSALSGGQFQRILLARALLEEPELLILDEATQGLDQPGSAAFYRQIEQLRSEMGCSVLMVSHELHVVMSASDRVICLNGHVCCHGTPDIVASAPEYRALFGSGTQGALALYRHDHDHGHDHGPNLGHIHTHDHDEHCDHA